MTKYILSISGGGIRGVIVAQFLRRLEFYLGKSLYDKFDFYAGTSTGSMIVSSIAYEKMSGRQLTNKLYNFENANKIMDKSLMDDLFGIVQCGPKYTNKGLKEVLDANTDPNNKIKDTEKDVIISAFDIENFKPIIFKSFDDKFNSISVKDAVCSSSAAPCYYPTYHSKKEDLWCIDGGVFSNCPADCAYAEALKLYGKDEDIRILSIGTGYNHTKGIGKESQGFGGPEWIVHGDLIDVFFKAPQKAVNYKMKVFSEALGHKYIHIDGLLEKEHSSMDDTSKENIEYLKMVGNLWFEKYKDEVLDILS